jgi:ABC-type xylose transport system permease subunit
MGIGVGIVLGVLGLILLTGTIQVDLPFIEDYTLGWILVVAAIVAILLALTVGRRGGTTVVERDVPGPPV